MTIRHYDDHTIVEICNDINQLRNIVYRLENKILAIEKKLEKEQTIIEMIVCLKCGDPECWQHGIRGPLSAWQSRQCNHCD